MKALLVHPGTQHAPFLAMQLQRTNNLQRFWTGFAISSQSLLARGLQLAPRSIRNKISNRVIKDLPAEKLRSRIVIELCALNQIKRGGDPQRTFFTRNERFQNQIPDSEIKASDAVIGFDTSSWLLVQRAGKAGKPFFLDQTTPHPRGKRSALERARSSFPEWSHDLDERSPDLLRAEKFEHEKSDGIVVASTFTKQTLLASGVESNKVFVNPYGVDLEAFATVIRPNSSRPLRFIFVGSVSARKGIPLLLKAWEALSSAGAELWIAGSVPEHSVHLIKAQNGLRLLGKVTHQELPNVLSQCDVLVLPSFFEGFGLVLLEALAAGLPIIATEATGAPDLIEDGVEGFIIPSGDQQALQHSMSVFVNNPDLLKMMSPRARRCAERYSWEAYGDRWASLLQTVG